MNFKKIKAVICWVFSGALFILAVTGLVLGYFIRGYNSDGEVIDGFGRLLVDSPAVLNVILKSWPGTIWFVIDIILLLFAIVGSHMLYSIGKDSYKNIERDYENNFF
ncbi:MAG: hypothetical protein AB9835_03935 [Eubacteriales bacterium]